MNGNIRTYVENVFSSLPQSKEAVEMKLHIIESMEDKYDALLAEGKGEAEAFGVVIGEFGSVEEIRESLGVSSKEAEPVQPAPQEDGGFTEKYDRFQRVFAGAIAAGVCLCIIAVVILLALEELFPHSGNLPVIVFLIIIMAAVSIFVYFGMQKSQLDEEKERIEKRQWQRETATFSSGPIWDKRHQNGFVDALQGIIMLGATAVFLISGFIFHNWHPAWVVFPLGGILCGMLSLLMGDTKR